MLPSKPFSSCNLSYPSKYQLHSYNCLGPKPWYPSGFVFVSYHTSDSLARDVSSTFKTHPDFNRFSPSPPLILMVQTTWIIIPFEIVFPHSLLRNQRDPVILCSKPSSISVRVKGLKSLPGPQGPIECNPFPLASSPTTFLLSVLGQSVLHVVPGSHSLQWPEGHSTCIPSDWNAFPQISTWISPSLLKVSTPGSEAFSENPL